jgi:hypothetical protein
MMKIYGPKAYKAMCDLLDYITWRHFTDVKSRTLFYQFDTSRRLQIYDNEKESGDYSLFICADGEIYFDFADEANGLMFIKNMYSYVMKNLDEESLEDVKDEFKKLMTSIEIGGTDWNVPFNSIKTAQLDVLVKSGEHAKFWEVFRHED